MYTRYLIPLSLLACASIVSSTPVLAAGTCMTGNFVIEHKCSDNSCVTGGKTSVSRAGNTLYDFIQEGTPQNVSVASMIGNTIESIDGYCTGNNGSCWSTTRRTLKVSEIKALPSFKTKVGSNTTTYSNGTDYLNRKNVKAWIDRVCSNSSCDTFARTQYSATDTSNITYLNGGTVFTDTSLDILDTPTIDSSNIVFTPADQKIKIGDTFLTNIKFDDPHTTGCTADEYEYTIEVRDISGQPLSPAVSVKDTVYNDINKFYKVGDTIEVKDLQWNITTQAIPTNFLGKLKNGNFTRTDSPNTSEINVNEYIRPSKTGIFKIYINIKVKGTNTSTTNMTKFITVEAWDLNALNSSVTGVGIPVKLYPDSTVNYDFELNDIARNKIDDTFIVEYAGSANNTNTMLQFQTDQSFTNGAVVATYANSIEVTTNNGAGSFKIYVFIPGTYDVKFKFTRKSRPSDFKVIDAWILQRVLGRDGSSSDFPRTCRNSQATLIATCTGDNASGCAWGDSDVFYDDIWLSQNGRWTTGVLRVLDNAGNITPLQYNVAGTFDRVSPRPLITSLTPTTLNGGGYAMRANNNSLTVIDARDDPQPEYCKGYSYQAQLWSEVKNGSSSTSGPSSISLITGPNSSGNFNLSISVTDRGGNQASTSKWLTIYPNITSNVKSTATRVWPDIFPGESINIGMALKDQFSNPVYSRDLLGVQLSRIRPNEVTYPTNLSTNILWNSSAAITFYNPVELTTPSINVSQYDWTDLYAPTSNLLSTDIAITGGPIRILAPYGVSSATIPLPLKYNTATTTCITLEKHANLPANIESSLILNLDDLAQQFVDGIIPTDDTQFKIITKSPVITAWEKKICLEYRFESIGDTATPAILGMQLSALNLKYTINGNSGNYDLGAPGVTEYLPSGDTKPVILWAYNDRADTTIVQTSGVKILGPVQGKVKGTGSDTKDIINETSVDRAKVRDTIRKNAFELIRNRAWEWEIIDGIRVQRCAAWANDILLSGDQSYETIITVDCNIRITGNLNVSWKKFGIIAIRNAENLTDNANIYIDKDVSIVQWVMYADGSLVSTGFRAGNDRVGNYTNSPIRRTSVVKQLVLRGSILTENTIGGAIKGTSGYKYPASSKEGDNPPDSDTEAAFSAALTYDLNFFRESNDGWDQAPNNTLNEGNKTNFVIIYNPSVIKSPPKGFKIR